MHYFKAQNEKGKLIWWLGCLHSKIEIKSIQMRHSEYTFQTAIQLRKNTSWVSQQKSCF